MNIDMILTYQSLWFNIKFERKISMLLNARCRLQKYVGQREIEAIMKSMPVLIIA